MFREKRRAERIKVKVPVSVYLFDEKTETILAGPVQGEARDFSPLGIALSLASARIDDYHLFFTCQDNPARILVISFKLPGDQEKVIEVPSKPAWYDRDREASEARVLLGIEFLPGAKDKLIKKLIKNLFVEEKTPSNWLKKIF